ncbi:MAG: hypothetical protein CL566_10020 [Alphaproteobacteria bacterium]|nr:hypothetical protein [Alphaproteobacteria bacterium]|tara:strand:- start:509 stop:889 length:381 start_codon:yes stop_codon:yes gene_type:complete
MQSLYRNIHAIVLTTAFAVAIAAFSASGAFAQATKLVFEERTSDSKTAVEFETEGRIEISWRATGGQFKVTVVDLANDDGPLIASAPQKRDGVDSPPPSDRANIHNQTGKALAYRELRCLCTTGIG